MLNCVFLQPHELSLKSNQTRARFEKRLAKNIKAVIGKRNLKRYFGSLTINSRTSEEHARKLKYVFGLSKISPAIKCNATAPEILQAIDFLIKKTKLNSSKTFGVRAKCLNSYFKSREIEKEFGQYILEKTNAKVDLDKTKNWFYINILGENAFIYTEKISGFGGLPVGVSGKCLAEIDSSKQSLLAAWLMARRGCEIDFYIKESNSSLKELQKYLLGYKPRKLKTLNTNHDAIILASKTPSKSKKSKLLFTPLLGLNNQQINNYIRKLNF